MRKKTFRAEFVQAIKSSMKQSGSAKCCWFFVSGYLGRDFPKEAALIQEMMGRPDLAAETMRQERAAA